LYVLCYFEHNLQLEMALCQLEKRGVAKERILAVPLKERKDRADIVDTIDRPDRISALDSAVIMGTTFMVLGVIYGFVWKWGPIIWGLIGLLAGSALGFIFYYLIGGRRGSKKSGLAKVILIIHCHEGQGNTVEKILWFNHALGVGSINKGSEAR